MKYTFKLNFYDIMALQYANSSELKSTNKYKNIEY